MFSSGKILRNVIEYLLNNLKKDYALYVILCMFEVGKSMTIIMLSYFGISVILDFSEESIVATIICATVGVVSEVFLVLLNRTMNLLEKKIEIDVHGKIVYKASKLRWTDLMDINVQKILTDGICEGKQAMTTLAVDIPSYIEVLLFCVFYYIFVFRILWWFPFVIIGGVCVIAMVTSKLKEQEYAVLEEIDAVEKRRYYYFSIPFLEKMHREITMQSVDKYVTQKRHEVNDTFYREKLRETSLKTKLNFWGGIILFVIFLLFAFTAVLFECNNITVQEFFTLIVSELVLFSEINRLRELIEWDKSALYHANNFFKLMQLPEECDRNYNRINKMEVNKIGFSYGDNDVLDKISFCATKGDKILILGENGAGKTTLLNILGGLLPVDRGKIIINDHMVFETGMLCKGRVAYVSQDISPLKLSFRENLFSPMATDIEIEESLRKVKLWDYINEMQQGIDTVVGEGVSLSKGQWQRFAIARLLLRKDADVWILDEPTASMDALCESEVLDLLFQEGKDKIIIVVTHRMTMARKMNSILCLESGKIKYVGTHDVLYEKSLSYKKLYDMQAKLYV